ncbi:MAG: TetR/AcrR family transcriptional regulator [Haliea sp.]|uniref:TetR/AcrR family transcriptional regulator n=1 Tax=Haliea sp. TaxID=1932666 RepID=UPI0032F0317D
MNVSKSASQQGYHKGNLRDRLISTAESLLQHEELDALSLRRVAREVGVAPSAIYNHFSNLDELLAAVAADGYRQLVVLEQSAYDSIADPEAVLRQLTGDYLNFAAANPNLYRLMFSRRVVGYRALPEVHEAGDTSFKLAVEWWYGKGSYDPARSAIHYPYALAVWSLCHGAAMSMLDGMVTTSEAPDQNVDALATVLADAFLQGARSVFSK